MPRRVVAFIALVSACCLLLALPVARASEVSHARIVRLSYTAGDVQSRIAITYPWQKAPVNTPLREGMELATGDGRAEVEFESSGIAWMASNTVMELPQLVLEDGSKLTLLNVKQGTATFYVKPGKNDSFAVQAGALQIHPPGNARFRVDVFDDGASVSVFHGTVDVDLNDAVYHLNSKRTLAFRNDSISNAELQSNPSRDGWDHWVSDRDTAVEAARFNTSNYVGAPFGYGMADLSFYGGWVNLPGYGYGWQPWGVGGGWTPFYNGCWTSFGAFGPTWVSYEPWGWVPYHYGGWVFSPIYGWVWAPGNFGIWNPATVAFVQTPAGVGWVPRGPREPVSSTPMNLSHGLVTNTPEGMLARAQNTIQRGATPGSVQLVSDWRSNAALARFSQQAPTGGQAAVQAAPSGVHPAQRMPPGPVPRNTNAGMLAGSTPRYHAPSIFHSSSHASHSSSGFSASPGSPAMSGGARSASPGTGTGSAGGRGGSGSSGGAHGKP